MPFEKVLIVEDEKLVRDFVASSLKKKKVEVYTADTLAKGKKMLEERHFDLLLTDLGLPDGSGLELLPIFSSTSPQGISLVMTGHGTIDSAVEAMRLGAYHYLQKPFGESTLEVIFNKSEESFRLRHQRNFYERESHQTPKLFAQGEKMEAFMGELEKIAQSDASLFIYGETGTGKEVIAKTIHALSKRDQRPFIKTNCAAIPETLLESEFFGHEKGAFTGALQKRLGRFEMAHLGTLLLDEVTEMPLGLQAKLLRALEEREFERVGGSVTVQVDVRIISTSNRNPKEAIRNGFFREDLFYRLHVIPLYLPPLRERKEEILPLAHHFLENFSKGALSFSKEAEAALTTYSWPGNLGNLKI